MKLVVVESPTKSHAIKEYLGKDFEVFATKGHLRDLSKKGTGGFGVDVNDGFKANYEISPSKYETVKELKKIAKKADEIYLASDPDREGEAIAWHVADILNLDVNTTKRLEFHEITRPAVREALEHPRTIFMKGVASQETRRIIDRIIGFKLSGLLQKKMSSRSAGRVQSAALKLIVDREREIHNFVSETYYTISLLLNICGTEYVAKFKSIDGNSDRIDSIEKVNEILSRIGKEITVTNIKKSQNVTNSKPPFKTSTLQQDAYSAYKFSSSVTMKLAQELFEGIEINGEHVGLITYLRTDSVRLSPTFIAPAFEYIKSYYGRQYVGTVRITEDKNSQDAHEGIRPTSIFRTPYSIKEVLCAKSTSLYKLYKLIYNRTIASLMAPRVSETTTITLESNGVVFSLSGTDLIFEGYQKIYKNFEEEEEEKKLPELRVGENLSVIKPESKEEHTEPPSRYSEGKFINLLEDKGIGRPSTYASTVETLKKRKYITVEKGTFIPTEQGVRTVQVLEKYFPELINVEYTANMELDLDRITEGLETKEHLLSEFYEDFTKQFDDVSKRMYKDETEYVEGRTCPKCGAPLIKRKGKFGEFIGCSNFPTCTYTETIEEPIKYTGENCPDCGKPLIYKKSKKGKTFISCSNYPLCKFVKSYKKPSKSPLNLKSE